MKSETFLRIQSWAYQLPSKYTTVAPFFSGTCCFCSGNEDPRQDMFVEFEDGKQFVPKNSTNSHQFLEPTIVAYYIGATSRFVWKKATSKQ